MNYINSMLMKSYHGWNKLDTVLFTSQDVFYFYGAAYHTRMFIQIIDNLIPTGVMKYLIEEHYTRKWKFAKVEKGPKVLAVDDLAFGFNIWLGSCLVSTLGFIIEIFIKFMTKPTKIKYAKVNTMNVQNNSKAYNTLEPELIEKFRIKTQREIDLTDDALGERIGMFHPFN